MAAKQGNKIFECSHDMITIPLHVQMSNYHAPMITVSDEMILCDYCGDDISPATNGHKTADKIYHQECFNHHIPRGKRALDLFRKDSSQSNVFLTAIHVNYLNGLKGENAEQKKQKRVKRDSKVKVLLKEVTALRNSTSGQILIHLVGREQQDTFSGAFDEFIDEKLLGLIHDGSLFTDVYTKQPMCAYGKVLQQLKDKKEDELKTLTEGHKKDCDQLIEQTTLELEVIRQKLQQEEVAEFQSFTDIIVLSVEGGDYLTTTDFKTKIALDDRIINPSDQTVLTCLRKKKHFSEVFHRPELYWDIHDLQESRSIQFKGYYPKSNSNDEDILDFMFKEHKLLEYASAFTKNDIGGSYFVGVAESDVCFGSSCYKSKAFAIQQVPISRCEKLAANIKRTFEETVLVCDYYGNKRHDVDLVKVEFLHSLTRTGADSTLNTTGGNFVIHVNIKPVSGIVFYDRQGPLAYRIVNNTVTTYTLEEWFRAIAASSQISKSTGQIMAKLEGKVKTEEENEFHLTSKDFLRPPLKQIGRSIAEIKSYFGKQGIINIVPSRPNEDLVNINDDLVSRIRGDGFLFKENIVKGASSETCKDTSGLVLLTKSAVPTFNLPTLPRTLPQQCDIFVAVPQQPPLLLTVVGAFPETKDVRDYNAHLTREVTAKLRLFTSESFNIVHGIICRNDLKDSGLFQTRLRIHAMLSSFFLPQSSFSMNRKKYDQVVTAFWAVIAETKSVFTENGDPNDMVIRFLTKEQCLVLVENMNNNHVQVRCETGSGATTLMLEVARRLSRLGETLLVCRSKEERDRLRSVHPSTISLYDVGNCDLSKFENVVHDTHAILHETSGRHWQFLRDPSTADLKKSLASVETVVNAMDSQLEAMKSEEWKQKMNYMQSEMDVLRLFHQLTGSHVLNTISHKMNMLPEKSSKDNISLPSLDLALEPDVQEPHLVKFMEGIQHQKDPFPILRLAVIEGKTKLMYLTAKTTFLEKATEASGDTHHTKEEESLQEKNQSKNVQQCLNTRKAEEREKQRKKQKHKKKHPQKPRHRRSSKEEDENCASPDVSKQHPPAISETQGQLQNTGADERQWSFDGTDKLKERLESLERARDENIRQLVPLLSVEWQNTLGFLKRNTVTLSWFGEDTKRFDYDQLDRHGPLVHETHSDQEDQEGPQIDTKSKKGFHSDTKEVAVPKGHDSTRSPFSSRVIGQQRCKHDSPVHQLRNFQLGRLDVMCIYKMLGRMTTAVNTSIAYLQDKSGHMEKAFGCPLHLVGELDSTQCYPVSCPVLFLDAQRVNQRRWHVTSDGKLVNAPPSTQRKDNTGLEEYSGTCSHIPILLPPDLLTTTSVGIPHTAQYWETHSHVGIVGGQGWPPILEMGLSEAGLVDSRTWVCNQPRSWCVAVWRCKKHGGKICTRTYEEGDFGGCMSDTMSDIPGTQATLHYGLVLDVGRGRLAFIDLNRKVVLAKYDVQFRDTLYPMFGVWRRSEDFSVALKLISGVDVTMSDTKRTLICQSLQ